MRIWRMKFSFPLSRYKENIKPVKPTAKLETKPVALDKIPLALPDSRLITLVTIFSHGI